MKLKKTVDFRRIGAFLYAVFFIAYLLVGLKPTADATHYEISAELEIPAIGLTADVTPLKLKDHHLETPSTIVGSFAREANKVLLIGHSSTVFRNLNNIAVGDEIIYDGILYKVLSAETLKKADVEMNTLLAATEKDTIVIMTCAGEELGENDATHRLIVTAEVE